MGKRMRMGSLMRHFSKGIQVLAPLVWGAAKIAFWSFITTIATLWVGVPTTVRNLGEHWEEEGLKRGISSAYARHLNYAVRVVACIVIAFEWVCFSFTTVYLIVFLFWLF